MDTRTPDQRKADEMAAQAATYGQFARDSLGVDLTPRQEEILGVSAPQGEDRAPLLHPELRNEPFEKDGYWGGVVPPAHDPADHQRLNGASKDCVDPECIADDVVEEERRLLDADAIEVKYTPNRAQRRAMAQAAKRSVRKGQRAADRRIRDLSKGMTPEQVERAQQLARKSLGRG